MIKFTAAETLQILRDEIDALHIGNAQLRDELAIQKARADHWRALCDYAYQRSREGCFTMPGSKIGREKRDACLSEINYRLGGAIR